MSLPAPLNVQRAVHVVVFFADKFDCERTISMIQAKLIRFKLQNISNKYTKICFSKMHHKSTAYLL